AARGRAGAALRPRRRARRAGARRPGGGDAQRVRPPLRHAARAARGRAAGPAAPLPRRPARAQPGAQRAAAAACHDRLRPDARTRARRRGRALRHRRLRRLRAPPRRLLPRVARRRADCRRAAERLRRPGRHRRAAPPRPRRRLGRARLGELRGDRGRLHPLRRRRCAPAGQRRRTAEAVAPAPARVHAVRLDASARARAAVRRRAAAVPLMVGARGPRPGRARVLAAPRRRARRRGAGGVRRGAGAPAVNARPYKGLASFDDTELDARLFFGRDRERETIVANLFASRLTVVFGPSGVGKSSLLRAGVAQELRRRHAGTVVVHGSWADRPVEALVDAIRTASPPLGATAGLADTVAACALRTGEVVLLLDQLEEYFAYHEPGGPLADALHELLRRPGLRVSVLLALREDALGQLDAFTGRLPEVFANLLRIEPLGPDAAGDAVVGPLGAYAELTGERVSAEPGLVRALQDEVGAGLEAPFLQLVLDRLWDEERSSGSSELRLSTLERLGGSASVAREHVTGALGRLGAAEQAVVARVVRQLVTPSGAKVALGESDLADYADLSPVELRPLLDTLARERILRAVDRHGGREPRFEIFHDVLAEPLLAWRQSFVVHRARAASR